MTLAGWLAAAVTLYPRVQPVTLLTLLMALIRIVSESITTTFPADTADRPGTAFDTLNTQDVLSSAPDVIVPAGSTDINEVGVTSLA